jgi:hypothetical protein
MRTVNLVVGGLLVLLSISACRQAAPADRDPGPVGRATGGAAEPVEGQLAAYNAHDLERFLSYYATDVQLHTVGPDDTSIVRGMDAMRESYAFLTKAPAGFGAEIVSRLVTGRYVIDHERIVAPGHPTVEAVAIYEVRDGLISRVWFLPDP